MQYDTKHKYQDDKVVQMKGNMHAESREEEKRGYLSASSMFDLCCWWTWLVSLTFDSLRIVK